jgi:predicted RNA-binding protein YlxR (DUF448 family)
MTRVVRNADGEIFADPTGKASGRGAYICNSVECKKKLADKKLLNRAFHTAVDGAVYEALAESVGTDK